MGPQLARPGRSRRVAAREPARMVPGHGGGGSRPRGAGGSGTRREVARGVRRARLRRFLRGGSGARRQPRAAGAVRIAARGSVANRSSALLAVDRSSQRDCIAEGSAAACKGAFGTARSSNPTPPPSRTPPRRGCVWRSMRSRARNWSASCRLQVKHTMIDQAVQTDGAHGRLGGGGDWQRRRTLRRDDASIEEARPNFPKALDTVTAALAREGFRRCSSSARRFS